MSTTSVVERAQEWINWILHLREKVHERYHKLSYNGKVAVWSYVALHLVAAAIFWSFGPSRIFGWMAGWAESLRDAELGWLLLLFLISLTSIPPMLGYGTCITLCGFAFGVGQGWLLAMGGCLLGSATSFLLTRRLISTFAPLLASNEVFKALATAVRAKGLPLVVLIRLCPFPFPYSNAFFASIESVSLSHFMIATLAITPKLLLHVWLGSRLYLFADPESREGMDTGTKIINGIYVVLGSILGFGTSWYLYKLTMKYVEEAAGIDIDDLEAGLIHDVDAMLDEDEEENEDDEGESHPLATTSPARPAAVPLLPKKRPPVHQSTSSPFPAAVERPRESTDNWEGSFSDFDEPEEEEAVDVEDPDPLGLGLHELGTRDQTVSVSGETRPQRDKRRD